LSLSWHIVKKLIINQNIIAKLWLKRNSKEPNRT
jgi:hypothetical protein